MPKTVMFYLSLSNGGIFSVRPLMCHKKRKNGVFSASGGISLRIPRGSDTGGHPAASDVKIQDIFFNITLIEVENDGIDLFWIIIRSLNTHKCWKCMFPKTSILNVAVLHFLWCDF